MRAEPVDVTSAKLDTAALRRRARADRDAISPANRASATAAATGHAAAALADLPAGALVGLYAAISSEISADALAAILVERGLALAYPRVVGGARVLAFHRVARTELTPGRFGIPEPDAAAPIADSGELAAIVIPGLLFDRRGHRLGWGRGHYDATLPLAPAARRLGLAFELQLVDELPNHALDCPVHSIATEVALHPGAAPGAARKGSPS